LPVSPAGGSVTTNAIAARSGGGCSMTLLPASPPFSPRVWATCRGDSRASIVPPRPCKTRWGRTVSPCGLSVGVASTPCGASIRPTWWDRAAPRWTPGAPCWRAPRRVLPANALAASPAAGARGGRTTPPAAPAPHGAATASRSTGRTTVGRVAAHGVWCGKPRAGARRAPSWRPQTARALARREPPTSAPQARESRAGQGWRVPRQRRKSGIAAQTSRRGGGCALLVVPLRTGLWRMERVPGQQGST